MENTDLSDFDFNESKGCWSVTCYHGKSEEVIFPAAYEGKPIKKIGDFCSDHNIKIKNVIIPEGYTSIGEEAFYDCTGLTNIKLPESLTTIGEDAFWGCTGLTDIKLSESLTTIGDSAFSGCAGLTNIKLPERLTSVGEWAFSCCTGLTNIKFPKSLTFPVEGFTFYRCTGLKEIIVDKNNPVFCSLDGVMFDKAMTTLIWFPPGKKGKYSVPDGVMKIESFDDCNEITSISFPQSLLDIGNLGAFWSEQLTDITVSELNPNYCSIDGVLFDKKKEVLLSYPTNKDKADYTVPDGVCEIEISAFSGCKRLVNVNLPESLKRINVLAFCLCVGLKAITLPMKLKEIGEDTFEDCKNLETITLSRKTKILSKKAFKERKNFKKFKGKLVYREQFQFQM
jgi:hypothetical protein